jgi:pentatricopeptide repeat protein
MPNAGLAPRLKMQLAVCAEAGHAARAFRICAEMKHAGIRPDIAAYNLLLHACAKQGLAYECLALLEDMQPLGLRPDQETYNHVLFVCGFESHVGRGVPSY